MGELLDLSPPELKFKFELRKNIPVTLSLTNRNDQAVAFKVKTTAPKKYCVRPSSGVVDPKGTKDIQVIMQAQREAPTSYADCKDKFLVQSCIVSEEAKDVSGDVFDKATDTKQTKLRVVLLGPPKPPSPVPEGVEEDYSPGKEVFKPDEGDQDEGGPLADSIEDPSAVLRERNRLRDQLKQAERDKDSIRKRLDLFQHDRGVKASEAGRDRQRGLLENYPAFSVWPILLALLMGLAAGYFVS